MSEFYSLLYCYKITNEAIDAMNIKIRVERSGLHNTLIVSELNKTIDELYGLLKHIEREIRKSFKTTDINALFEIHQEMTKDYGGSNQVIKFQKKLNKFCN